MLIYPPHKRTIFVNYPEHLMPGDKFCDSRQRKYTLNLPELQFTMSYNYDGEPSRKIKAFSDTKKECYVPFPNIDTYGDVCLGYSLKPCKDDTQLANGFFSTTFSTALIDQLQYYLIQTGWQKVERRSEHMWSWFEAQDQFFRKWEKTGKVQLIQRY